MNYGLQVCICENVLNERLLCTAPDFSIRILFFFFFLELNLLVFIDPHPDRKHGFHGIGKGHFLLQFLSFCLHLPPGS